MGMVYTSKGMIPREELELKLNIKETESAYAIGIEFWHGQELVKRSVMVDPLVPLQVAGEQGKVG